MLRKLIKNLLPITSADFIGVIIISWTLSPTLLIGDSISSSSIVYRFLTIPVYVANTILIPLPEGLGGLAVVFYNVLLLIGIVNVFVFFINNRIFKTTSFVITWWTLLLILVATLSVKIGAIISSQKYAVEMSSRTKMMDLVEIKTEDCIIMPSDTYRQRSQVTCNITLYNMPAVTNNPDVLIYLSFAEENSSTNERYSLGHVPFVNFENTDIYTYQGSFTLLLKETTDPMGVHIEGIEMHSGFDKYFTSMLKHPLY